MCFFVQVSTFPLICSILSTSPAVVHSLLGFTEVLSSHDKRFTEFVYQVTTHWLHRVCLSRNEIFVSQSLFITTRHSGFTVCLSRHEILASQTWSSSTTNSHHKVCLSKHKTRVLFTISHDKLASRLSHETISHEFTYS